MRPRIPPRKWPFLHPERRAFEKARVEFGDEDPQVKQLERILEKREAKRLEQRRREALEVASRREGLELALRFRERGKS